MRRHVLVVYKKSAYQLHVLERKDAHLRRLLRQRHPDVLELRQAHLVHRRTLEAVIDSLTRAGVRWHLVYRAHLRPMARYDVIVCVGGDGTVLRAAHVTPDGPILGVNSDPQRSEAVFCAATAGTFDRLLRHALQGTLEEACLHRLQVRLNGRPVGPPVLNDVLIAHDDPATMSRYRLTIGAVREFQKSSGLWVATAAGSSSATLAAGGRRLSWTAAQFQYRPRELYRGRLSRARLTGGVLDRRAVVDLVWLMRTGLASIDGPGVQVPLRFGDRIQVAVSRQHPLRLLGVTKAPPA